MLRRREAALFTGFQAARKLLSIGGLVNAVTLRTMLGRDIRELHELLERLLDREDALIMLIDRDRAVSFGTGFGLSPCQLEFVSNDIERAVRSVAGAGESVPPAATCRDDDEREPLSVTGPSRDGDAVPRG